jgi:hypothetical protein
MFSGGDSTMKKLLAFGLILTLVFIVACGKKEVKKQSFDSKLTVEAFAVAENLRQAYLKNDRDLLEKNTTRLGYDAIVGARKGFDSVELVFVPALVELYGDSTHVYVQWNGVWKKGEETFEDKGLVVFVMKEKPLKLDNILRANPFNKPE